MWWAQRFFVTLLGGRLATISTHQRLFYPKPECCITTDTRGRSIRRARRRGYTGRPGPRFPGTRPARASSSRYGGTTAKTSIPCCDCRTPTADVPSQYVAGVSSAGAITLKSGRVGCLGPREPRGRAFSWASWAWLPLSLRWPAGPRSPCVTSLIPTTSAQPGYRYPGVHHQARTAPEIRRPADL
jgi:hypothetical protein